jgi:hypothetical protein
MKVKHLLIVLLILDLLLLAQIVATAKGSQSRSTASIHSGLNDFVSSVGFKKFKHDHFPKIMGEINTKITFRNNQVVQMEINRTNIRNQHFLEAFSNLLRNYKIVKSDEQGMIEHCFYVEAN